MKILLGLALVLSLCLVPTKAAPPKPDQDALCNDILFDMLHLGGSEHFTVLNPTGLWLILYGTTSDPHGHYKGCPLVPAVTAQFGPYSGNVLDSAVPGPESDFNGYWQIVSATQTSNPQHIGP